MLPIVAMPVMRNDASVGLRLRSDRKGLSKATEARWGVFLRSKGESTVIACSYSWARPGIGLLLSMANLLKNLCCLHTNHLKSFSF